LRRMAAALSAWLLGLAASRFAAIVAVTEPVASRFPAERTIVIHNYPRLEEFQAARPATAYRARPANLAYVGGIAEIRGLREMMAAVHSLPADLDARLRLAGRFQPASLASKVADLTEGANRVDVLGWMSTAEIAEMLAESRIGLCLLHPLPNYLDSLPTKLFEYMAAGLPVVASDFPVWRGIVTQAGCGILVDPLDVAAIAAAIEELLRDPQRAEEMGRRGRAAVEARYSWSSEAAKLEALYQRFRTT
jgi:glycosyltransferase involved in cell wall biosynthesis